MTLAAGSRLGPYEILAPLGAGGMGEVWRAVDTKLGREVALKVLPEIVSNDPERLARFEREAHLLASLNHPHIAAIYGLEDSSSTKALVLELVEGETLEQRLAQGPLPLDEALPVARQIAEALEVAHERGIIHRDLKPANVKVTAEGSVKVLDFGLAKALEPASGVSPLTSPTLLNSPTLTAAGTQLGVILGTAGYMAPEQAKGRPVDKRADIWAFGALVFEMLSGQRLFAGETVPETLASVLRQEVDFGSLPAVTPPRLLHLLHRCLERDPRNRLRDIGEARIALDPAAPRFEAPPAAAPKTAPASAPRWTALLGGLLVLALGVAAGRALRRPPEASRATRSTIDLPAGWWVDRLNRSLAFSPDGTQLVLALREGPASKSQLVLRQLDRLENRVLEGGAGAVYPFWSPDGASIGFFADGKLKRLDVESGSVRTVCDAPSGRGASWSPRGTIAFAPVAAGALAEVSAAGGTPTRIACAADAQCQQRLPQYLPDGRRLLFYWDRGENSSLPSGVYVLDSREQEPRLVLEGPSEALYVPPGFLAFVREKNVLVQPVDPDRLVSTGEAKALAVNIDFNPLRRTGSYAFSASDFAYQTDESAPVRQLAWLDSSGRELASIGEPAAFRSARPSPDGRRALAILDDGETGSAWMIDLERGLRTAVPTTFGVIGPAWSTDGATIAIAALDQSKLILLDADGRAAPRDLLERANVEFSFPQFLPDGSGLVFAAGSQLGDKQMDVWLLPFAEGATPRPILTEPINEAPLGFSPDGRWLLFSMGAERRELYVTAFPALGRKWLLADDLGGHAAWRSDREVLYSDGSGTFFSLPLRAASDGLEVGAREPAFGALRIGGRVAVMAYLRSRDRMLVATEVGDRKPPPLVLVTNWRAALGR